MLLSQEHAAYALDIPGHGFSEMPNNWEYRVEDIELLLKLLQTIVKYTLH